MPAPSSAPRATASDETAWQDISLVRWFLEQQPRFARLCAEVQLSLQQRLEEEDIPYAAVTWRTKTLRSYLDKIVRRGYDNPREQVQDIAGIRVVHLFHKDVAKIEKIILRTFEARAAPEHKGEAYGLDRVGYLASHYIVGLRADAAGLRYEPLKDLCCEIQVRTPSQDAWALLSHHLVYKHEIDIPNELVRDLNLLAAQFEMADKVFEQIRAARLSYQSRLRHTTSDQDRFLEEPLNLDSLREFLVRRFPEVSSEQVPGQVQAVLAELARTPYRTLGALDELLVQTEEARRRLRLEAPRSMRDEWDEVPAILEIVMAVGLRNAQFRENAQMPASWRNLLVTHASFS
jgi:ppGpp synthetase/RelA/SpoT-type nucleotidyltranferase